jgi:hypothetical protein
MRWPTKHMIKQGIRIVCCICFFIALGHHQGNAQPPQKIYTIKNGKMVIQLDKRLSEKSLDSFIAQYNLRDLSLKQFINAGFEDSLKKLGWEIAVNNDWICTITKPLVAADVDLDLPYKILFEHEEANNLDARFPAVSSNVLFGYNRFRNKYSFRTNDSVVTFFMRNNLNARRVMLAGSFNRWQPDALAMTKTDSGWIAHVKLGPGKYWYKFIPDGNWTVDNDNRLNENDGLGNTNSVFYKINTVFKLTGFTSAKKVFLAGSFNNWKDKDLEMTRTADGWELPLYLADGTHTYRYVVDGVWYTDPGNKDRLPNEFNDYNSVIRIGKPVLFTLDGYTDAKEVVLVLSGSFNKWRWDELYMQKTAGGWELPYTLGPGNYDYRFMVDGKTTTRSYMILEPNFTFRLKGFPDAKSVYLAGEFNSWSPDQYAMKRVGDEWIFSVHLFPGKHLYKFVVDGNWIIDPGNKLWEQDGKRSSNSVLWFDKRP